MKKLNYLKQLILAIFCSIGLSLSAQTSVGTFTAFDAAFQSMKTSGGGTITLTADITFALNVDQTYSLTSTVGNEITINAGAFKLIADGQNGGTTVAETNAVLEVGNYVEIYGTGTRLMEPANRGTIRVAGGLVKSTPTANSSSTLYSNGSGYIEVTGGKVSMDASANTGGNPFVIYVNNYMNLKITGGTIEYINTGGNTVAARAIRVGTSSTADISGVTITINDAAVNSTSYAVFINSGRIDVGSGVTINAPASTAFVADGATAALIVIGSGANPSVTAATEYSGSGGIFDLSIPLTIVASPASGHNFVSPDNVTFTITGNEDLNSFGNIYYTLDESEPTTSGTFVANGGTIPVSNATNTIKAIIGKASYLYGTSQTFTYTVQAAVPVTLIGTFQDLKDAYEASKTATGTSKWQLTANITVNETFTMEPDATHPVEIDANGKYLQSTTDGSVITYGGNLTINSTAGIFKINNATTTNITGGTYTVTGNAPVIFANTGSGVSNTGTKINLSGATFTADGTNNSARIINMVTSDGNLISAENCTFNVSEKGLAFAFIGPQEINFKDCIINISGSDSGSKVFSQLPTNAVNRSDLTIDGVTVNMAAGDVFTWGGSKNINTVIKDLTLVGGATITTPTGGTGDARKFYDFRSFTIASTPVAGNYEFPLSVALDDTDAGTAVDATGATIVYTTDGTDPIATSTPYSAAFNLTGATTVKAAMLKDGFVSVPFTFVFDTPTGLNEATAQGAAPYIQHGTLYLPEAASIVTVIGLNGQMLVRVYNEQLIDVSSLDKGVYIVKMADKVYKVVK